MARMSIDDMIARDTRIDRLAKLCGWSRRETRACLEDVWALCYDRVVPYLPVEDIEVTAARDAISPPPADGFVTALRKVGLARDAEASDRVFARKDGTRVPWPDQNWRDRVYLSGASERVGYLLTKRSAGSEGGVKSGQSRRSRTKQSFNSASSKSQARGNPPDPVPDLPSAPDPVPDQIPDPPLSLARDPAVSSPAPGQPAAPSAAPEPTRPIERPAIAEGWRIASPPGYDPADPFSRGRLAEATWRRVSDARLAIAAELKLPAPIPFDAITPGSNPRGFVELATRIREAGANAPAVCDAVVANLIKQARTTRSIVWLAERAFGDKAWPNARDGIDPSARPSASPRIAVPPPARRLRPDPPTTAPVITDEDRAAMTVLAAAAAAAPERGREIASLPTAELVRRFGDGQRAPPASARPDDPPNDEQPRRKAAK